MTKMLKKSKHNAKREKDLEETEDSKTDILLICVLSQPPGLAVTLWITESISKHKHCCGPHCPMCRQREQT